MANPSGQTSFNLDLTELVEEAFERCGSQLRSGYDLRTARRSLNLLTIEWANRGINLWTIEEGSIALTPGQAIYPLPVDTIDLLDQVIRQNNGNTTTQTDINISRISESTYATIPNKLTNGRPIQVWINRQNGLTNAIPSATLAAAVTSSATTMTVNDATNLGSTGFVQIDSEIIAYTNLVGNVITNCWRGQNDTTAASHASGAGVYISNLPCINVWPTPNSGGNYTFVYWRMRRIQDAGGGINVGDIPFRWIPCMVAGLASHLAMKLPDMDPTRAMALKQYYEEVFNYAAQEDREKASIRFVPRNMAYMR